MTKDPNYELLQAAKGALIRLEDAAKELRNADIGTKFGEFESMAAECDVGAEHLRSAIRAVEEQGR